MVTLDKIKAAIKSKRDRADFEKFIKQCRDEKDESIKVTRGNLEADFYNLRSLEEQLAKPDVTPDELCVPMHNLISIEPTEQYRFFTPIKQLFHLLPLYVKDNKDVAFAIKRLKQYTQKDMKEPMQMTDLSQYLCAYRRAIYIYGVVESDKQIELQEDLHKRLHNSVRYMIQKRQNGIKMADMLLKMSELQKQSK